MSALLVNSQFATAQVTSFGSPDCGQWFTQKNTSKLWLLGYLSGVNAATATKAKDPLDKLNSADQAFLWMDKYCQKNPLSNAQSGANRLYDELILIK